MSKLSENRAKIAQILADIEQLPEDRYYEGKEEGRVEGRAEGEAIGYKNALAKRTELVVEENGTYEPQGDSTGFKSVKVAVPERVPNLQEKTATENGDVVADEGYDGLSKVTVNVGGVNKLAQVADKTVTEITEADLQGATEIGANAFYGCRALKSVHIPAEVKKIGDQGFINCSYLSTATFAEGSLLLEIGMSTFTSCPLTSVTIPANVVKIGQYAFQGCSSLRSVALKPSTPPTIQAYTFFGTPSDCVFTVPRGCADAYKSATNWSNYADKIVEGDV